MKRIHFLDRLLGKHPDEDYDSFSDLNSTEKDMIRGIVELSDTSVKEVMLPRIDVVFLPIEMPLDDMLRQIIDTGFSRFPVYQNTIDNVVGILYVKDLLKQMVMRKEIIIKNTIRNAYFVPESKRLDSLLIEFKRRKVHIAIAVDEYGGVSGIVCLEDIIEEIVGDILDEFDQEEEDLLEIGENIYLCDARMNIEDLFEQTGISLPDEDFDTIGGFVFDLFGKIPVKLEKVTYKNYDFIIQEMEGQKIKSVKIAVKPQYDEKA